MVNFKQIIKEKIKKNAITQEEANLIILSISEIILENKFNDICLDNISFILQQMLNANFISRKSI